MQTIIAVIGGTGKAGQYLVQALLEQGYPVRLLLRHPAKLNITSPLITIVQGDVCDYDAVATLLEGCNAVISTLGGRPPVFTTATANILRVMEVQRVQRYIMVTGLSINVPGDKKSLGAKMRSRLMKRMFPAVIGNKQEEYRLLAQSKVDWTVVRSPFIVQTAERGLVKVNEHDCPGIKISAASLAQFLVSQLNDRQYLRKAPFIANT